MWIGEGTDGDSDITPVGVWLPQYRLVGVRLLMMSEKRRFICRAGSPDLTSTRMDFRVRNGRSRIRTVSRAPNTGGRCPSNLSRRQFKLEDQSRASSGRPICRPEYRCDGAIFDDSGAKLMPGDFGSRHIEHNPEPDLRLVAAQRDGIHADVWPGLARL